MGYGRIGEEEVEQSTSARHQTWHAKDDLKAKHTPSHTTGGRQKENMDWICQQLTLLTAVFFPSICIRAFYRHSFIYFVCLRFSSLERTASFFVPTFPSTTSKETQNKEIGEEHSSEVALCVCVCCNANVRASEVDSNPINRLGGKRPKGHAPFQPWTTEQEK